MLKLDLRLSPQRVSECLGALGYEVRPGAASATTVKLYVYKDGLVGIVWLSRYGVWVSSPRVMQALHDCNLVKPRLGG